MKEITQEMLNEVTKLKPQDRALLGEFYDIYQNRQWFNSALVVENHPTHMRKTLVVNVQYRPLVEMKEVLSFVSKHNLALDFIVEPVSV
jgi:hypothetical protein